MLAEKIYCILNNYRKNPYHLMYEGKVIISQLNTFIENNQPIELLFPACHGKTDHSDLVLDHLPDMSEFLGIQLFVKMCNEIQEIYWPGVQLLMVHEGHFYVDTPLIASDASMDGYLASLRGLLRPHPFLQSYALKDFFPKTYSNPQCRDEFFEKFVPNFSIHDDVFVNNDVYKNLFSKYFEMIFNNFEKKYLEDSRGFNSHRDFSEFYALKQLHIWIGFRKLLSHFFGDRQFIRLSSVYKDPSVNNQIALNYLPSHHLEMPSFYCVVKTKDGDYRFIKNKDAVSKKMKLQDQGGFRYYQEII